QVRVPELAGVGQADRLTVLLDVGDDEDLRVIGQQELLEHMDLQWAEAAAEIDLLLRGDALVAEHQQAVVQVGTVNPREIDIVQRLGQVQADDLGTQWRIEGLDLERLGGGVHQAGRCECRHKKGSMQERQSALHFWIRLMNSPTLSAARRLVGRYAWV